MSLVQEEEIEMGVLLLDGYESISVVKALTIVFSTYDDFHV